MSHQTPDRLLVVGECGQCPASSQVPQSDGGVVGCCDDLGISGLCEDTSHCVGVPSQGVDVDLGPHVPDPGHRVPAAGDQDIQGGMEREVIDSAEMTVVVTDHLVILQIPALDLSVLPGREEVGLSRGHRQTSDH